MRWIREAVRAGVERLEVLAGRLRAKPPWFWLGVAKWSAIAVGVTTVCWKVGTLAGGWWSSERDFDKNRVRAAIADAEDWRVKYWAQRERSDSIEFVNNQLAAVGVTARAASDRHEAEATRLKQRIAVRIFPPDTAGIVAELNYTVVTQDSIIAQQDSALHAKDVRIEADSLRILILTVDRDAWKATADSAAQVFADFKAGLTKELRKHDCSIDPFGVVGCPSRKVSFAAGVGVGAVVVLAVREGAKRLLGGP